MFSSDSDVRHAIIKLCGRMRLPTKVSYHLYSKTRTCSWAHRYSRKPRRFPKRLLIFQDQQGQFQIHGEHAHTCTERPETAGMVHLDLEAQNQNRRKVIMHDRS